MGRVADCGGTNVVTFEQVSVPRTIAQNLTFPKIVTPFNTDRMQVGRPGCKIGFKSPPPIPTIHHQ